MEKRNCFSVVCHIAHALAQVAAVGIYRLCSAGYGEKTRFCCWLVGLSIAVVDILVAFVDVQDSHVDSVQTAALEQPFVVAELSELPPPCAFFATCCSVRLPVSAWHALMRPCCCLDCCSSQSAVQTLSNLQQTLHQSSGR